MSEHSSASRAKGLRWPNWLAIVIVFLVLWNGLPFLAPALMNLGWDGPGRAIYLLYSTMCHQMAQRSFFLFGPQGFEMYSLAELPVKPLGPEAGHQAMLPLKLFLGSSELGWKVAWSDRMVYMYLSTLLAAVFYWVLRRRGAVQPLPLWAFFALLLPMALDGGTHWLSDLAGIGRGFRDDNLWLAALTNHAFSTSFYAGDGLGSFNSLMRLLSGVGFGAAVGGLLFPLIDNSIAEARAARIAELEGGSEASMDNAIPSAELNQRAI